MSSVERSATLRGVGEAGMLDRLKAMLPAYAGVLQGIGDDAAALDMGDGRVLLLTVDTMVGGEHFLPGHMPWHMVGRKAMASAVSDILAMNGIPRSALVALCAPPDMEVAAVEALYAGLRARARDYGVALVGGDTTRSPTLTISVTVTGEAHSDQVAYRSGARPGDLLCVTGHLGASHAGLRCILTGAGDGLPAAEAALSAHCDPAARMDVVLDWHKRGFRPTALTDISDGLATEIYNLCNASRCGAIVEAALVPIAEAAAMVAPLMDEHALDYALYWGEDYELLFSAPRHLLAVLDPRTFVPVGRAAAAQQGVLLLSAARMLTPLPRKGWEHFQS